MTGSASDVRYSDFHYSSCESAAVDRLPNRKVFMGSADKSGVVVGLGKRGIVNRFEPGESKNFGEASIFYRNEDVSHYSSNYSASIEGMRNYYEIVDDARLADRMYAIRNDARAADSIYSIRNDARLADRVDTIRNDVRLADDVYAVRNDARLADDMYAIRNFNNGKDEKRLDGIRVSADCLTERKDKWLDIVEMKDHAGTFLKDSEERIMFDRESKTNEGSNLAGMIFMCNKQTKKDCFHHSLFGLPFNSWNLVKQVVPGSILFLFEYEARQMWGIYEAVSHGTININPSAYSHPKGGSFPAQVRVKEIEKFPPLEESEFKDAIRDNYFSDMKFELGLSWDQVLQLCEVFLQKSANRRLNSLDKGLTHSGHSSGEVKESRDFVERSDEMPEFRGLIDEEYFPIESIERERENFNEGQRHGFMSDYSPSEQYYPAFVEYHHPYSDRSDKRHLRVKNDDVPCWEEESGFLRTRMYDFTEGQFSGRVLSSVSENKEDELHGNANVLRSYPHNSKVNSLNGSNTEASRLVNDRIMPLAGIYHSGEYTPSSVADLAQPMHKHLLGEECRNMLLAGLELDASEEGFRHVYANRPKQKSSVWSRISGFDNLSLSNSRNRNIGNERLYSSNQTTRPSTQDGPEKFVTREQKILNGQNTLDCIVEEPLAFDQPEIVINFKRRKSFRDICISQESEKTRAKKRRKLVRPDFSDCSEAQDKGKNVISTHKMELETKKQPDLIQHKLLNSNFVVGGKQATCLNSGKIIKQLSESGQTSHTRSESEPVLSIKPSQRCVELDEPYKSCCKELGSNGDMQPESNNQLVGVSSGGNFLMEKGSKASSEQGTPLQMGAGTCGNVCTRQTDDVDDNRSKVSGGRILTNESLVKATSQRAAGNSYKLIGETNIGIDCDKSIARGEVVSKENGQNCIYLGEPPSMTCIKKTDEFVHSSLIDDDQNSNASIAGHGDQNPPPCLCLQLTMVPDVLLSTNSAEVTTGEISGQDLESCQS